MRFDIITIFPQTLEGIFAESILAKAKEKGLVDIQVHDLRKWTDDKRKTVDDRIFGGGPGMLLQVEPVYLALKELGVYPARDAKTQVILTSAAGQTWQQSTAASWAQDLERIVIICGHYEGVDHRVVENLIDLEISIGNYVLTGGELPAAVIVDSVARLLPGVLGNEESLAEESHSNDFQDELTGEYPQYSRPAEFTTAEGETWSVPEVLLSGNHQEIKKWRQQQRRSAN